MRQPRKSHKLSKLMQLPQAQRDTLRLWLTTNDLTYLVAVERMQKEFGVTTNKSALSEFYQSYCVSRPLRRPAAAAGVQPGVPLFEIVADYTQPGIVRFQFIPGAGCQAEVKP